MTTNLKIHSGTVTGDATSRFSTAHNMGGGRWLDVFNDGTIGALDAPAWLNTGRMVGAIDSNGLDVQFQQQDLRPGYMP